MEEYSNRQKQQLTPGQLDSLRDEARDLGITIPGNTEEQADNLQDYYNRGILGKSIVD